MAAKEILCLGLCFGMGQAPPLSDKCDFVDGILNGPESHQFRLNRTDGDGARRTRKLLKDAHRECERQKGDQK